MIDDSSPDPIAIIGIGCRLPGRANSPSQFWKNLLDGIDAITEIPADRWNIETFYDHEAGRPGKSQAKWGGFIDDIDQFDPHFFGISPREAARMDPQQRLLLEVAWESLEDAGQPLGELAGQPVGVFVGISSWDYSVLQTSFRDRGTIDTYTNTGGSLSIAANRISYCFDLKGPSMAVDTACSSALVAVHLACRSIWVDGCSMALAGGVNALLTPEWYVGFSRLGMLSPDGRCKAFDARGNGFVRAEGAGVVVLKPLVRALADGDRVYAVIRGTAVNQDGRTPGMTVPDQAAQEELIRQACRAAKVSPAEIQYVEAHGTGTPVGDPIEAAALGRALSSDRPREQPCLVGSVKTNIGHLEAGSGIAGLIKTALAIYHRRVPGNLHFERPNPNIDFDHLRLRVPTESEPWPSDGPPLAGINSFGYGGTNAHIILGGVPLLEAPAGIPVPALDAQRSFLVPLSARSPEAVRAVAESLARFVSSSSAEIGLADIAWNMAMRRTHHEHRLAVVARSKADLAQALGVDAAGESTPAVHAGRAASGHSQRVGFVCAGQGPQWWAMGRELLEQEPIYRNLIERCDSLVRQLGSWSLLDELTAPETESRMAVTAISQPAIFALQVGLAAVWSAWGILPAAIVGHSVGEVAAAYIAGVFSLEDAVRIIYHRGRSMELAPTRGRMLAVGMSSTDALRLIRPFGERLSLAAVNGPASVTLSGEGEPLEALARDFEQKGIFSRFLRVNYAFHSAQMDPVRAELIRSLAGIAPRRAELALFSTVSGERLTGPEMGPDYWWQNVRRTVRFEAGIGHLLQAGCDIFVELSPHPVLASAVAECARYRGKKVTVLASLRREEDERATMLGALGVLYAHGPSIDWTGVTGGPRPFVRLPSYPWQKQRCWAESEESRRSRLAVAPHPLLGSPVGGPSPAWEARIDTHLTPYLTEHRVQQATILPATAYLEAAFAVAREVLSATRCTLADVRLSNPCFLSADAAVRLHTEFLTEEATVRINSRPVVGEVAEWIPHVCATLRASEPSQSTIDFDQVLARCPRTFSEGRCYDYFSKLGLDYGPRFRGLRECRVGVLEALGTIELPAELAAEAGSYSFHPALLDACFQVVITADADFDTVVGGLYLPIEFDQIRLDRKPTGRLFSHARHRSKTARQLVADVDIYDETGLSVAHIRGIRSLRVAGTGARAAGDSMLYAYEWRSQPLTPAAEPADPGDWLIIADRSGLGECVAERLRAAGGSAIFASADLGNQQSDGLDTFLREVDRPIRGVLDLRALDSPRAASLSTFALASAAPENLLGVVSLVQAWERTVGRSTRLVLATRGAQSVGERPQPVEPAQAPLLGLGRVIANECSLFTCRMVDLDPAESADLAGALFAEMNAMDDEDEIAWRGGERFAHRFVPSTGDGPADALKPLEGAYRLDTRQAGSLDGLTLQEVGRQPPSRGHVEIEVHAAGLNFSDVMKALGIYPGLADGPVPFGAECSGVVTAVGAGVDDVAVGDEVFGLAPFAFASHVVTRGEFVVRKPAHVSFEDAATVPIAFLTAVYAFDHLAHIESGERVLIHSATGGVGLAAVQIARRAGAEIFATAGTPQKRQFLAELGIQHVMDSRTTAFADEVMERTSGRGVDAILNSLPGEAIARGLDCLGVYGRFLEIGKRDIYANKKVGLRPFRNNLSYFAIDLDRVMRERPCILASLLRGLANDLNEGRIAPLPTRVFPIADVADAFRHMQSGKHIGKVVLSMTERPTAIDPGNSPPVFRKDATYLIAGGLGGFGLATARWMIEHGAGHLVLVGRRGAHSDDLKANVAGLEASGARVLALAADIASPDDLRHVLATIDTTLPPLRGALHAAMVLEDCLLQNLDCERLERVLTPKVQGAWNLHQQTADRALDFFVMYSSLSSVFGHAGQANYAAANAFLDALATYRRAHGLPGLAINWGHIGEVGYLAQRQDLGDRLEQQGVMSIPVKDALELIGRMIRRRAVQVSVMRIEWSRWRGLGVTGRVSPRFAELLATGKPAAGADRSESPSTLAALLAAPAESRSAMLEFHLRDKFARVLGTQAAQLDTATPLLQLGIDSLMTVELLNWIAAELGVSLPAVELMRSPGLSDLTALLLGRLGTGTAPGTGIGALGVATEPDAPEPDAFPLSHGQRGLWFLHQMDSASPSLTLSFCSRIRSLLDVDAYRRELQGLVDRHPSLRTTFEEQEGELVQRVHEQMDVALEVFDAADWSDSEFLASLVAETEQPFNLGTGPLLRTYLFRRAPDDHVLLLTAHHIIGDFWSLIILLGESGRPGFAPRKARAAGYWEFVRWQNALLNGPAGADLGQWWEDELKGVSPVLELPGDRPRPPRFSYRGGTVPCRLDAGLTSRLRLLSADEGTTLYTVLLAGFQALLGRYSGRDEFLVGSPFAGRSRREFEEVVGCFMNILPLRADLSGDPSVRDLIRRVSTTVLGAFEHQDYPFSLLVERVHPPRDPSRTPLVQVLFVLQKAHRNSGVGASCFFLPHSDIRLEIGQLQIEPFPLDRRTCQADLELILEEVDEAIEGMLCYNSDLFDPASAARMVGRFQTLLAAAVAAPEECVSRLPWFTPEERADVLDRWSGARTAAPPGEDVVELFDRQARATPDAIAIRCNSRVVRYAELASWSDRIALGLCRQGAAGQLAGACMERSPDLIATAIGVWKAGAVYFPLDPDAPRDRLDSFFREMRTYLGTTPLVLSQGRVCRRLPRNDIRALCIDTGDFGMGDKAEAPPAPETRNPRDLAYAIFTSGSSGHPKGVLVEHGAIANTIAWRLRDLPQGPEDRVLMTLPAFFDASLTAILPTLATGGQLILAQPGEELDPVQFLKRVAWDGVTIVQCLPSILGLLLDSPDFAQASRRVRRFVCGGETMPTELPVRLRAVSSAELVNVYGPTEAAVEATCFHCSRGTTQTAGASDRPRAAPLGGSIPIGRPIANIRAYVLDAAQQPVPVGIPGELYLGGAGLAREYLNDPELTASRFVPDPFDERSRLFRTGDGCRWLNDGTLEYLGRLDRQVKLRGYRIELGEIEAALAREPGVREALVTLQSQGGEDRLIAYVVRNPGAAHLTSEDLRGRLGSKLPRYMVPTSVILLDDLPRIPSGKVDLVSLLAIRADRPSGGPVPCGHLTPLEEFLVGLWRERLGADHIDRDDHFFDVGGTSLQAVQVVEQVREKLGREVHLSALFDSPTIAAFARHLGETHAAAVTRVYGAESVICNLAEKYGTVGGNGPASHASHNHTELVIPLQERGSEVPLFLVHPPGGIVICYGALARRLGPDRPVYAIRARGVYGGETVPSSLEEMAAEYAVAIRAQQPSGPYFIGGWSIGGIIALETARQVMAAGGEVEHLILLDSTLPFGPVNADYLEGIDLSGREFGLDMTLRELAGLSPDDQLPFLWEHVRKVGLVDDDSSPVLVQLVLDELKQLFHAHVQLAFAYALRPYPGRITLLRPGESIDALARPLDRGWGRVAAEVDVLLVPGKHHTMVAEPHVQRLAEEISRVVKSNYNYHVLASNATSRGDAGPGGTGFAAPRTRPTPIPDE